MLHIGKSFYFSFVSDSLSIKNIGAFCDSMGMYMSKTDSMRHGIFVCFRDLSNNRIGCLTPEMFVGLNNLHKL